MKHATDVTVGQFSSTWQFREWPRFLSFCDGILLSSVPSSLKRIGTQRRHAFFYYKKPQWARAPLSSTQVLCKLVTWSHLAARSVECIPGQEATSQLHLHITEGINIFWLAASNLYTQRKQYYLITVKSSKSINILFNLRTSVLQIKIKA